MPAKKERITRAAVGDSVTVEGETFTVAPKCATGKEGRWVCMTHKATFTNQFAKDGHIMCGCHKLAWFCFEHQTLEVP
jgi:hypothetical protein